MLPNKHTTVIELSTGNAMIAGAGFDSWTYRPGFDISLPAFSPYARVADYSNNQRYRNSITYCINFNIRSVNCVNLIQFVFFRSWLVVSSQINIHSAFLEKINHQAKNQDEILVLHSCPNSNILFRCHNQTKYHYPEVLQVLRLNLDLIFVLVLISLLI